MRTSQERRGSLTKSTPHRCVCPECGKTHYVDTGTLRKFGVDCFCLPCVDWSHVVFMRKNAKRLGMTCATGCRCGFGKPSTAVVSVELPDGTLTTE